MLQMAFGKYSLNSCSQSNNEGSSTLLPEAETMECRGSGGTNLFSRAENDSKKRVSFSLTKTAQSKGPSCNGIKKHISGEEKGRPFKLKFEIELARRRIRSHFMNMKIQMDNDDVMKAKEMEIWTQGGLANIDGEKNSKNEFFIKSLINNFEEIIGNIEMVSKRELSYNADGIRKILVELLNRIERRFRQKPRVDAVKMSGKDAKTCLWIVLWSLVAVLIAVFPDHFLRIFESAVALYQSTILVLFLFCILYFLKPECK